MKKWWAERWKCVKWWFHELGWQRCYLCGEWKRRSKLWMPKNSHCFPCYQKLSEAQMYNALMVYQEKPE